LAPAAASPKNRNCCRAKPRTSATVRTAPRRRLRRSTAPENWVARETSRPPRRRPPQRGGNTSTVPGSGTGRVTETRGMAMVDVRQGRIVHSRSRAAVLAASVAALLAFAILGASSAQAYEHVEPGFESFEVKPTTSQAGGHPDVNIDYIFRIDKTFGAEPC